MAPHLLRVLVCCCINFVWAFVFCSLVLIFNSSFTIILLRMKELDTLLQFLSLIMAFPDHTHSFCTACHVPCLLLFDRYFHLMLV